MKENRWPRWVDVLAWLFLLTALGAAGHQGIVLLSSPARAEGKQLGDDSVRPRTVTVRAAKAEKRLLRPRLEVIGTVLAAPDRLTMLAAPSPGVVETLIVPEGAEVARGELVIQLDERPLRVALARAEAAYARLVAKPREEELTQARAQVSKMRAAADLAETRLQRTRALRTKDPALVPDLQLLGDERMEETSRNEWETAEAQLKLLEKGPREELREESRIEVEAAKLQLQYCKITAPIRGTIVEIKTHAGQRADPGTPLLTILDSSEVVVQARVPGESLAGVEDTLKSSSATPVAIIRSSAFPDETFPAAGGWLSPQTEAGTGDVPVKLRVPNPGGLLRVGMSVQVELFEPALECVAIPETALAVNEEGHRVTTVIRDGRAVPTEVAVDSETEPEIRAGGWVRVIEGLSEGDLVATENGYALPEGTPVNLLPSGS